MPKISAVIVTWNEEKNITRAIKSVKPFVDELVVVDMGEDNTINIARKLGARVFKYKYTGYVEPARNYAIGKATGDWIFILDADEEITENLGSQFSNLCMSDYSYYEIPRKNIIFNKWIEHTRFWPDYLVRLFKKGSLSWPSEIHVQPKPVGVGKKLDPSEKNAIIHHHYQSISQYLLRLNRYTDYQLVSLTQKNYIFNWTDIIRKPTNEFLSRYYSGEGYKDGLHGLALSLLQAFSELVLYLKLWENKKYPTIDDHDFILKVETEFSQTNQDWLHWKILKNSFLAKLKSKIV